MKQTRWMFPITRIVKVIDGDSIRVEVDLGFKVSKVIDLRIEGIDTPEVRGLDAPVGKAVRKWVKGWFQSRDVRDLWLDSTKLDKYGRSVGNIRARVEGREDGLANALLSAGMAKPYDGGSRPSWSDEELQKAEMATHTYSPLPRKPQP